MPKLDGTENAGMMNIIRTYGMKDMIISDLRELNGFHELTEREIRSITQPEWKTVLSKHYPDMDMKDRTVSVDLTRETITLS